MQQGVSHTRVPGAEDNLAPPGGRQNVLKQTPAAALMRPRPRACSATTSLQEATTWLLEDGQGGLPVVDAAGRPVGMLGQSDVLEAWVSGASPQAAGAQPVQQCMVPYVLAVDSQANLALATSLMAYEGVQRVLVLGADKQLVGMITTLDVLRWLGDLRPAEASP